MRIGIYGYRDYDPDIGRWTAKDPIGFAGRTIDLYGYVLGAPVNFVDPDGLWSLSFDLYALVGAGITIGGGEDTRPFISFRYGLGFGGGLTLDPKGKAPSPCPESVSDIGFAADIGAGIGPLSAGAGFHAGICQSANGDAKVYAPPVKTSWGVDAAWRLRAGAHVAIEGAISRPDS